MSLIAGWTSWLERYLKYSLLHSFDNFFKQCCETSYVFLFMDGSAKLCEHGLTSHWASSVAVYSQCDPCHIPSCHLNSLPPLYSFDSVHAHSCWSVGHLWWSSDLSENKNDEMSLFSNNLLNSGGPSFLVLSVLQVSIEEALGIYWLTLVWSGFHC